MCKLLQSCGAVIAGSFVLSLVSRRPFHPNDIDVFVKCGRRRARVFEGLDRMGLYLVQGPSHLYPKDPDVEFEVNNFEFTQNPAEVGYGMKVLFFLFMLNIVIALVQYTIVTGASHFHSR
jgi:hypothetical protein